MSSQQNFRSKEFVQSHFNSLCQFQEKFTLNNPFNGYNQELLLSGRACSQDIFHLVNSCRMVHNFCKFYSSYSFQSSEHKNKVISYVQQGISFIEKNHFVEKEKKYNWIIKIAIENNQEKIQVKEDKFYLYGMAHVLLMYSCCKQLPIPNITPKINECFEILEQQFLCQLSDKDVVLYKDLPSQQTNYRGQNANMHLCEAFLEAYKATGDQKFKEKALKIAYGICVKCANLSPIRLVWEHYDENWQIDYDFNKGSSKDFYKPWGYQIGHQIEWAKLLLLLFQYYPNEKWIISKSIELLQISLKYGWDDENEGFYYSMFPSKMIDKQQFIPFDEDKYFWVQAEAIACLSLLISKKSQLQLNQCEVNYYLNFYDKIFQYIWIYFCQQKNQPWQCILNKQNLNEKNEQRITWAGFKSEYHTIGALALILTCFNEKEILE